MRAMPSTYPDARPTSAIHIGYNVFFFFQAEDGIRDKLVTGVQTCALPIFCVRRHSTSPTPIHSTKRKRPSRPSTQTLGAGCRGSAQATACATHPARRPAGPDHAVIVVAWMRGSGERGGLRA